MWQRLQGLQDATVLTTTTAGRRWLLEDAGAAFQHVLTASTVMYGLDQAEHCPIRIRLRAWTVN